MWVSRELGGIGVRDELGGHEGCVGEEPSERACFLGRLGVCPFSERDDGYEKVPGHECLGSDGVTGQGVGVREILEPDGVTYASSTGRVRVCQESVKSLLRVR